MAVATRQIHEDPSTKSVVHPYDLPKSMAISYEPKSKRLSLDFNYIVDEPVKELKIGGLSKVYAGKNSHRIVSLAVSTKDLQSLEHITFVLLEALQKGRRLVQEHVPYSQIPRDNYDILNHLIENCSESIIEVVQRAEEPMHAP